MPDIISAYTGPYSDWDKHLVSFFPDKYVPGGAAGGVNCPLVEMLRQQAATDAHFAMYWGANEIGGDEIRATKGGNNGPLNFDVAAFDLDYGNHVAPPAGAFEKLVRLMFVIDDTPNLIYETQHGARILYTIERIDDPEIFEQHYQALIRRLAKPLNAHGAHGYHLDEQAKDWTRLFRCPHVTRKGTPMFHFKIREYHSDKLDLRNFKSIKKPKPVFKGDAEFDCRDPYIWNRLSNVTAGINRNSHTFAAAAWALKKYDAIGAEKWLDLIARKASEAGLDDREIEQILNSARKAQK